MMWMTFASASKNEGCEERTDTTNSEKVQHRDAPQSNSFLDFNDLQELSYIDQAVLLSPLHWENPLSVLGDQYDLKHRDDGILPEPCLVLWAPKCHHGTGY